MRTVMMVTMIDWASLTLGGCATGPSAEQLASADYGAPVERSEAEANAERWIEGRLKDPESARYDWTAFEKGWVANGLAYGGGYLFGYRLEGTVNARNAFGGYVGRRQYILMFHDGEIVAAWGERASTNGGLANLYLWRLK